MEPQNASRHISQEQYHGFSGPDFFNTSPYTKMTLSKSEDKCLLAGKGRLKQLALIQREPESLNCYNMRVTGKFFLLQRSRIWYPKQRFETMDDRPFHCVITDDRSSDHWSSGSLLSLW